MRSGETRWGFLCAGALLLAGLSTLAAKCLLGLIGWVASAAGGADGGWRILVPALGGAGVALLARFGTRGVLGHGIPEVMQQVLANRSRIAPRVMLLKPALCASIKPGTMM